MSKEREKDIKEIKSSDCYNLKEKIKKFADGDKSISKESIVNELIEIYKFASAVGIRDDNYSDKDIATDRKLIENDLDNDPKTVYRVVDELELDFFDYERDLAKFSNDITSDENESKDYSMEEER